mmetsp:Transcript_131822/g.320324  ORF Transcript_131822/g.320324 Transcript_131822/m.320324 type:complete len:504 (+) Transcript_131822:521-2032(+)
MLQEYIFLLQTLTGGPDHLQDALRLRHEGPELLCDLLQLGTRGAPNLLGILRGREHLLDLAGVLRLHLLHEVVHQRGGRLCLCGALRGRLHHAHLDERVDGEAVGPAARRAAVEVVADMQNHSQQVLDALRGLQVLTCLPAVSLRSGEPAGGALEGIQEGPRLHPQRIHGDVHEPHEEGLRRVPGGPLLLAAAGGGARGGGAQDGLLRRCREVREQEVHVVRHQDGVIHGHDGLERRLPVRHAGQHAPDLPAPLLLQQPPRLPPLALGGRRGGLANPAAAGLTTRTRCPLCEERLQLVAVEARAEAVHTLPNGALLCAVQGDGRPEEALHGDARQDFRLAGLAALPAVPRAARSPGLALALARGGVLVVLGVVGGGLLVAVALALLAPAADALLGLLLEFPEAPEHHEVVDGEGLTPAECRNQVVALHRCVLVDDQVSRNKEVIPEQAKVGALHALDLEPLENILVVFLGLVPEVYKSSDGSLRLLKLSGHAELELVSRIFDE